MKKISLVFIFFFLLMVSSAFALVCAIRDACFPGETCIFSVYQVNNSHVAECGYYPYSVCCSDVTSSAIRTTCIGDENPILSVYQLNNSHVARLGYYGLNVCVDRLNCTIRNTCEAYEVCLGSLYQLENSHFGSCEYYANKVCCGECDSSLSSCQACFDANILSPGCTSWPCWFLGGDAIGANTCCGDDGYEFKITRVCLAGVCPTEPGDDACCRYPDDCVWQSTCYRDGFQGDVTGDDVAEYCDAGVWIRPLPPWKLLWRDLLRIFTVVFPFLSS
jgi:hypothetical protein